MLLNSTLFHNVSLFIQNKNLKIEPKDLMSIKPFGLRPKNACFISQTLCTCSYLKEASKECVPFSYSLQNCSQKMKIV